MYVCMIHRMYVCMYDTNHVSLGAAVQSMIYIYIYIYIYACVCSYTYIHICMWVFVCYTHTHTHTHTHAYAYAYTHTYSRTPTLSHKNTNSSTNENHIITAFAANYWYEFPKNQPPYNPTLKCIIIETQADSVVVKSNGLGPVLAAIMHPGRLFNIVEHVSWKKSPKPFDLTTTESARVSILMHFRVWDIQYQGKISTLQPLTLKFPAKTHVCVLVGCEIHAHMHWLMLVV